MQIHLDLREMLPTIRTAFDNHELQAFRPFKKGDFCSYAGPCAIGICVPDGVREKLDEPFKEGLGTGAYTYFNTGVFTCPDGQRDDIENLQSLHDKCLGYYIDNPLSELNDFITQLEEKYSCDSNQNTSCSALQSLPEPQCSSTPELEAAFCS